MNGAGPLAVGSLARDISCDAIGRVTSFELSRVWLRPIDGGREWDALPGQVEPVTDHEIRESR
ncbi:hypothetical protein [Streptomyces sp. 6N223]|uniref:hypothetical protein n=1 Tax=Streptomyces sp. 6N223 TaxID=3457412 RepID=UPI003FD5D8BF